jgi:hypothetical protein
MLPGEGQGKLLNVRFNTRNLQLRCKRFNILIVRCIMCREETLKHLFFECEFAQSCWTALHIVWDLSLSVLDMVEEHRRDFQYSCYIEVIMLATRLIWMEWSIWIYRNKFIFKTGQDSLPLWKKELRELLLLWKQRAKSSMELSMVTWLSSL